VPELETYIDLKNKIKFIKINIMIIWFFYLFWWCN